MAEIIITERQLQLIKERTLSEYTNENGELINEAAWYNTVMDILGIFDPTPIVDIINATSYFIQGDTLFGILSIVGAIPYAGTIEKLAKEPGVIGTFLKKMGGPFGEKVIKTIDEIPAGPFKGMKDTIKSYFQLLSNAGKKGAMFQKRAGVLARSFQKGTATVKDVELLKNYLKTQKVFNPATLTKPGFFTNVFFGGIPRLFRSPDQRRLRILMQSTKWWLGFLDYIGLGNWVGAEELAKKMGEENFAKKVEEYNQTPEARQNFEDQFGTENMEGQTSNQQRPSSPTSSTPDIDPFAKWLRNLLMGQLNPVPGM